jgi:hypothetical protein
VAEAGQRPSAVIHYSVLPPLLFLLRPPAFPPSAHLLSSLPFSSRPPKPVTVVRTGFFKTLLTSPPRQASGILSASTGIGTLLRLDRHRALLRLNRHRNLTPHPRAPRNDLASGFLPPQGGFHTVLSLQRLQNWIAGGFDSHLGVCRRSPPRRAPLAGRVIRGRCGGGVHSSRPSLDSLVLVLLPDFGFPLFGSRLDRLWERSSPRQALGRL